MLRSLKNLEGYTVSATDGDIGNVVNFLLDDEHWVVRHLVVETSAFHDGRRVLISPISFRDAEWSTHRFHLALTKDKIKNSPRVDSDKPVSRQQEGEYYGYYGYPNYWAYGQGVRGLWGAESSPSSFVTTKRNKSSAASTDRPSDSHLRSANEVRGYHTEGSDGSIGHIEDFIVDDETWAVRYLVIDTSNWWFGKKVLVAPRWASRVSWNERKVHIDLSREVIKASPIWDATAGINREYESRLHDYYGRPVYWADEAPTIRTQRLRDSSPRPGSA